MRCLEIPNRLKWMKVCALAWLCSGKACSQIAFAADWKKISEVLEPRLLEIRTAVLDKCLAGTESGEAPREGIKLLPDGGLLVFGIIFRTDAQKGRMSVPFLSA